MMVEVCFLLGESQTYCVWLKDRAEARAVVEKVLEPAREVVAIDGYERKCKWHSDTGDESTVRFLPKTLYINEFVLAVEVTEYPDEQL